jgi:hypothetical protein
MFLDHFIPAFVVSPKKFKVMLEQQALRAFALDLRTVPPRSPRATLAGYVLAARIVDKCRASLIGQNGEYSYAGANSLDTVFFDFTGIAPAKLRAYLATGADDEAVTAWIVQNAKPRDRREIIKWNNQMRDLRLSDVPLEIQEYMEDYIAKNCPKHRPVYQYFDIYDLEEGRL